jgi:hypothetical protein
MNSGIFHGLVIFASSLFVSGQLLVTEPPDEFFQSVREKDRSRARAFYKKHVTVGEMPVVASAEVSDEALRRTRQIATRMLAGRPDILEKMVENGMYLIIIGKDQVYTDMPEYSDHPNPAFQNERVRGTGGKPTSFGEENLLSLPIDRYDDESIAVHEFCHTIDSTLRSMDPTWHDRRNAAFQNAKAQGLWKNTYAASNAGEYWAEIAQSYFDCNRVNNWNHGPIRTREQLKVYDPEGYELVRTTFNLKADQDWRYSWLQPLPNVIVPPAQFNLPPYFTKFTYAREFPVVGRLSRDSALLKANDTVRRMFAYRHDILKAFIDSGTKLVVLGSNEKLSDIPEAKSADIDHLARFLEFDSELKLMAVSEENILESANSVMDNQIIRLFAKAIYDYCGNRPIDPNWEKRGREVQQYELRVQRIDERFKREVDELFAGSKAKGLWRGSSALNSPAEYFARGVMAYFDAAGQDQSPEGVSHPISTREQLREYDPELFRLITKTMAYEGRLDWRAK